MNTDQVEVLRGKTIYFYHRPHYEQLLQWECDQLMTKNAQVEEFGIRWMMMADFAYSVETGACLKDRSGNRTTSLEKLREQLQHPPQFVKRIPKPRMRRK